MNNRDYKRLASRDIGPGGAKCPCCVDRNTVRRGHRRVRHESKTRLVRMACEREGVLVVDIQGTNTPDELMDMVVEDLAAAHVAEDEDLTNQAINDRIEAQLKGIFR